MTVPSTVCRNTSTATGSDSVYPYTFRVLQASDLVIQVQDLAGNVSTLILNTDYTVDGVLSYTGGNVTLLAGNLTAGYIITRFRDPAETQNTSLQQQGAYDAKVVETMADKLTMEVQALNDKVSRAPQVPGTTTIPAFPSPEALALIGWNALGDGFANYPLADLSALLATGNFTVDAFAAGADYTPGSTTTLTLSKAPGTVNNTLVLFDGVAQQKATYSVTGLVATFSSAIPIGVLKVEVTQSAVLPLSIPADNSVATATIQNLAVTAAKLAADAVTTVKITDANVTTAKIADAAVTAAKIAAGTTLSGRNGIINGDAIIANGVDYAATVSGTYAYGLSPLCKGALFGTAVAGSLTAITNSACGRTGRAFKWSAITTTGAGIAKMRFFVEARDAIAFKNQTCSFACQARQDTGGAINFAIVVSKANAADDFSATTVISTGANVSVPTATNTNVYNRAVAMGDCSNGIMVEITAAIGAVTNKNVELTELQFNIGTVETEFEFEAVALTAVKVARYYEVFGAIGAVLTGMYAPGQSPTTTTATCIFYYAEKRIAPTGTVTGPTDFSVTAPNGAGVACTALAATILAKTNMSFLATVAAGLTVGNATVLFANGATAKFVVDARL